MTVTVVSDVLGAENNGTTIAAMNLIRSLRAYGHEVRVVCSDQDKKGTEGYFVVPNLSFGRLLDRYVAKVGVALSKPERTVIEEALDGADVVHVMFPFPLAIAAARMAKERGIPVTSGFHMQAQNMTGYIGLKWSHLANNLVYKLMWRLLYKNVDIIHYPAEFIRNLFESKIHRKTEGRVISNGVHSYVQKRDVPRPKELSGRIIITSTGRYANEKAQDVLIKAVALSSHKDNIQLILAGQGVKENYYRRLAKKLPIEPIFKLYDREELIDVLNYSDIYVHPADAELEGIACLEAVVLGKLTIVSDSPLSATRGFAVDERCIFKNRDPRDLARLIDFWIEHPEQKTACERKYFESARVYRQEECMKKMEEMLLEAARGKS